MLSRLSFYSSSSFPSWTTAFVAGILDLRIVLETFATKFEEAKSTLVSRLGVEELGYALLLDILKFAVTDLIAS